MCLMSCELNLSTFLTSCACSATYIKQTESFVILQINFPSWCLYFMTKRHLDGFSRYSTSAAFANSSQEWRYGIGYLARQKRQTNQNVSNVQYVMTVQWWLMISQVWGDKGLLYVDVCYATLEAAGTDGWQEWEEKDEMTMMRVINTKGQLAKGTKPRDTRIARMSSVSVVTRLDQSQFSCMQSPEAK